MAAYLRANALHHSNALTMVIHQRCGPEPCEAIVSQRCGDAQSSCGRGLVRMRLRQSTHLMVPHDYHTTRIASPCVLARFSNSPARPHEQGHLRSQTGRKPREGTMCGRSQVKVPGGCYHLHRSGVAFPFVIKRLSNTPARPQEASPCSAD